MKLSPTARALQALELIQANPGITADRLADRLGVTDRAARRYVALLRDADLPITATRGPYGGYRLGRGLRLPPLTFNATEALGLVMAVLDGHHRAGDPNDPVGSGLGKLIRALPEPIAAQAEAVRQHAAAAPDPGAARPDPEITTELVHASATQHRVRVGYTSEFGRSWQAEIDPWAVVVRHGRWYVLAWSHAAEARRVYRVDRVSAVELLEATFHTPPLDPVAVLEEHLAEGWAYRCEVLVDAPPEQARSCLPAGLGRLDPVRADGADPDGAEPARSDGAELSGAEPDARDPSGGVTRTRLTGTTDNPWWYAEQLAGLPWPYRIVDGPELRHAVRAVGLRMVAAAGDDPVRSHTARS